MPTRAKSNWLLYGAYGFTGRLLLAEAVRRGHRPVLAGRDAAKLAALGTQYDLDWLALELDYADRLAKTVERFSLVFHAAGPFIHTAEPMQRACLAGRTHYLDITGEIPVYENTFAHDAEARARGVVLMSGAGFDIVPSDCLARYVADQLPGATHLETAMAALSDVTSGTVKSGLVNLNRFGGNLVRRDGRLVSQPLGKGRRRLRFSDGRQRSVMPFPWGDVVTAYHSTGIPNITAYLALPRMPGLRFISGPAARLMAGKTAQRLASRAATLAFSGPDEAAQRTSRAYLYARAYGPGNESAEAWLETGEAYSFTALAGVRLVERVLAATKAGQLQPGSTTPAAAFGADFVLDIEGVRRVVELGD